MKAEDIEKLWGQATDEARRLAREKEHTLNPADVRRIFARACEQHGIERAKVGVRLQDAPEGSAVWFIFDWSALDAEIAKENLERANPQPRIRCAGHYGEMYPRDDSCGWEGQPVELRNGCCPVCGAGHFRPVPRL